MINSTKFSAKHHLKTNASLYTLFTGTAIRIFEKFGASYIDIKGDGVFALFNKNEEHKALAASVTFKTFISNTFLAKIESNKIQINTGAHIGIHQGDVLVSKIGFRKSRGNLSSKNNEVWAGKTINFTSKLSSYSKNNIVCYNDFFKNIKCNEALYSCNCKGESVSLWTENDTSKDEIPFEEVHILNSLWCVTHGAQYLQTIIDYDK
jgi:class 3 adenylate cyclase